MEILTLEKLKSGNYTIEQVMPPVVINAYNEFVRQLMKSFHITGIAYHGSMHADYAGVAMLLVKGGFAVSRITTSDNTVIDTKQLMYLYSKDTVVFMLTINLEEQ